MPLPDNQDDDVELISDVEICKDLGVTAMTIWRYERNPALNFPSKLKLAGPKGRNHRDAKAYRAWKRERVRGGAKSAEQQTSKAA